MKIQCNVCEAVEATVLCCADEAALCLACDQKVHAANKLASKHLRVSLTNSESQMPKCDICQETVGYLFCLEDRALLCRKCDVSIHTMNTFVAGHQRFLLTGVKVGLEHTETGGASSSSGKFTEKLSKPESHPLRKETVPHPMPRETVPHPHPMPRETVPHPLPRGTVPHPHPHPMPRETVPHPHPMPRETVPHPHPMPRVTVPHPLPRGTVPHPLPTETVPHPHPMPRETVPHPLPRGTVPHPLPRETVPHPHPMPRETVPHPHPMPRETVPHPHPMPRETVPHLLPRETVQLSSANQYNRTMTVQVDDFESTKLSLFGGTTENTQQWQLDEFIELSELNQNYGYMDNTSSKIGDEDCSPILRSFELELDLDSDACLGQVPDASWNVPVVPSPPTASGLYWPKTYEP